METYVRIPADHYDQTVPVSQHDAVSAAVIM